MSFNKLSTKLLIDSYNKANQLKLENDFISLLGNELQKRKLEIIDSSFEEKMYL